MERLESLVNWWIDLQSPLLEPLVFAAGYAALLAAIVLVINVAGRRWLTVGQMAVLWGLVLVRLALPVAPALSFSLASLWNRTAMAVEQLTHKEEPVILPVTRNLEAAPAHAQAAPDVELKPVENASQSRSASAETGDPLWMAVFSGAVTSILVVYPFVAVAILAWTAFVHWRFCRVFARQAPTQDERLLRLLDDAKSKAGVTRSIPLYVVADQPQPSICGLWTPAILLPTAAAELPGDRLQMLLLHELAHVRRGDVAINWMLAVLKAAHWWNPVFWLAAARFGALREQACDAFAIARSGEGSSRDYGEMLLHFAAAVADAPPSRWQVSIPASLMGISLKPGHRGVQRRLNALREATRSRSRLQRPAAAVLAVALAVAGWSEAKDISTRPQLNPWMPPLTVMPDWSTLPHEQGNIVSVDLDVADALRRHRETGLTAEQSETALTSMLNPVSGLEECRIEGSTLKLTARQSVVDDIVRQLEVWKEAGFRQIVMECRIITAEQDLATPIGVGWQTMGQVRPSNPLVRLGDPVQPLFVGGSAATEHSFPVCVAAINDSQSLQFVRAAQSDRLSNVMFAPKVTVFNGGTARTENHMRQPFVVGVEEEGDGTLKPTIQSFDEGLTLLLCPTESRDHSEMRVTGRIEAAHIVDVMTVAARTKRGREVNVQVPRVNRVCIDVDSTLKMNETLLIGCLPSYERKGFQYLMVTPRPLEETEARPRTVRKKKS
ncbi:Regulatory protein BlaR1 [Caulifigura coniformis]|uniref:Regulatory protein BlaR1 n=1 Tax=Caulifigura coniformis TaxID=2527983 RepID=A0A517S839_9PLAN|nr:M56 family metallopeptidase [Caulifigura coniformis]QDT52294.1 Regulatory protein BlaR1 [Caulifigura coniformis]